MQPKLLHGILWATIYDIDRLHNGLGFTLCQKVHYVNFFKDIFSLLLFFFFSIILFWAFIYRFCFVKKGQKILERTLPMTL